MLLRDHFRAPLAKRRSWDMLHGGWPMKLVEDLLVKLPKPYAAAPGVHLGSQMEIDVVTYEDADFDSESAIPGDVGVATALYAPAKPTLDVEVESLDVDEYEVRVYDTERDWHLVAAIEIVSPANKDRASRCRAFVAKCATLLSQEVLVMIVDLVTNRTANLCDELLEFLGGTPSETESSSIYTAVCHPLKHGPKPRLKVWNEPLIVGQTLPLWLSEGLAIPLDLNASYEETCRILQM